MKLLYPASYMSSQMGMTVLLVGLGLFGKPHLAAEVGIVQGALIALYYTFSGNVRSLIFREDRGSSTRPLILVRLLLAVPLAVVAYILAVHAGVDVAAEIAMILTLRKIGEWLSEIHLCEVEREGDRIFALIHLTTQSVLLAAALLSLCLDWEGAKEVLLVWALLPPLLSLRHLLGVLSRGRGMQVPIGLLLPHIGSSMVHGVTIYVFRLTLLLLVGKMIAGDLYTAFSIGGLIGSVFATAIGPSMVLHEQRIGNRYSPLWLSITLLAAATLGAVLVGASLLWTSGWLLKTAFFWQAAGLSLVGGVVMMFAQRERLRLLQGDREDDVFAPDVLLNILIVTIVPFVYYLAGPGWLGSLYLFNAILAMAIYRATIFSESHRTGVQGRDWRPLGGFFILAIFVPLFFQLGSGIFRSADFAYDTVGILSRLPVPVSIVACFVGIALIGRLSRANLALSTIFFSFLLMVVSTVVTSSADSTAGLQKLILMMQFLLPMFALVLGQTYGSWITDDRQAAKALAIVLGVVVPAQLVATWSQGFLQLSPYLYAFSIYQHLLYVPVILVGAYLIGLNVLWNLPVWHKIFLLLALPMGIYVVASTSMLATGLLVLGSAAVVWYQERRIGRPITQMRAIFLLAIGGGIGYWFVQASLIAPGIWEGKIAFLYSKARLEYWVYYAHGFVSNLQTLVFGNVAPPARESIPSAHNYYLDIMYNFGVLGVMAIFTLVAITMTRLYKQRGRVMASPGIAVLAMVVLFLVVPDNLFKVGMRQMYPGIVTFFLWGLLLTRLEGRELAR